MSQKLTAIICDFDKNTNICYVVDSMNNNRVITARWPRSTNRNRWAGILGISPITIRRAEIDKKLKTYKALNNRYVMIDREEICRWLKLTYQPKES